MDGKPNHRKSFVFTFFCDIYCVDSLRWPEKPPSLERSGTQYVAMVTRLSSLYYGEHLVESYNCKESNISDANWLRYLFSSYLMKIWLGV